MVKVKAHGIGGKIWGWIDDWLKGRKQRVTLNGRESDWIDVLSGVLQGSVLVLVLFVIYINDIDSYVSSKILKFADDTKIVGVVSSPEGVKQLRQDLVDLYRQSNNWLMLFNTDKCKVMNLGNKHLESNTNLFFKHANISELFVNVNNELHKISKWFKLNKLPLNIKKLTL